MTDLNLVPIIRAIANLASSPQLNRNEIVMQLRKKFGLNLDPPPSDFTYVYRAAIVEYGAEKLKNHGVDRPKLEILLELFRQEEIIQAFRKAFEQNNQSILLKEGEYFLDWNILGDHIRESKFNIPNEFNEFKCTFIKVANSTRTPADVIDTQKIDKLQETLEGIQRWNNCVNIHGVEGLVSFEIEDSPAFLGIAEPDDARRQKISLGQGFRLVYQLPVAGYGLLMQGFKSSWVVTRLGKCENSTVDEKTRYIQERIAVVRVGSWSVPTNKSYLKEKTDVGLHRFVLLLSTNPFSEIIQEMIFQERNELSLSALNQLVEYIENNTSSVRLLVVECDIFYRSVFQLFS